MSLIIVLALAATLGLTACSDSDPEAADTPADASTAVNSAVQTDEEGETVTTEARPGVSAAEEEAAEEEATGNGAGDVAAGQQVFAANCTGCHLNDGKDAGGVGPQLADNPNITDEAYVEGVVTNGQGAMPAGLVSGEDLTNVAAYVVSLQ
jgi:cytochrome c551